MEQSCIDGDELYIYIYVYMYIYIHIYVYVYIYIYIKDTKVCEVTKTYLASG